MRAGVGRKAKVSARKSPVHVTIAGVRQTGGGQGLNEPWVAAVLVGQTWRLCCQRGTIQSMPHVDRESVVRDLVAWHFRTEPALQRVFVIKLPGDHGSDAPVRLLEVSSETVETGSIEPFGFAPTADFPFRTMIAAITPREYEDFVRGSSELRRPPEWDMRFAEEITRPAEG